MERTLRSVHMNEATMKHPNSAVATILLALCCAAVGFPAAAAPDTFTTADRAYLSAIRSSQSGTIAVAGNERYLIEIGILICEALRSERPVGELVRDVGSDGVSAYDAFVVTSAASVSYCPDTVSRINRFSQRAL